MIDKAIDAIRTINVDLIDINVVLTHQPTVVSAVDTLEEIGRDATLLETAQTAFDAAIAYNDDKQRILENTKANLTELYTTIMQKFNTIKKHIKQINK